MTDTTDWPIVPGDHYRRQPDAPLLNEDLAPEEVVVLEVAAAVTFDDVVDPRVHTRIGTEDFRVVFEPM